MKICIFGAGAIGGALGVHLAQGGHAVSLVARGPHLQAIKARGLTLRYKDKADETTVRLPAGEDPAQFGPQDLVVIGVKAHGVPAILPRLQPLLGPDTIVLPALNGIPWWYFQQAGGRYDGRAVHCLDPDGAMLQALDPARVVGCVVYGAGDSPEPGVIRQTSVDQPLTIGEANGAETPRLAALAKALSVPGLKITTDANIRNAIWTKLLGNVAFNPISALARADMQVIAQSQRLNALVRNVMTEAVATGNAHGITFAMTVDQRLAMAGRLGPVKPSMLQDVEQGRPMEVEAIVGAVVELARLENISTPTIDAVYALISGRDATLR